jgi:uncharacterized transporter YbjL
MIEEAFRAMKRGVNLRLGKMTLRIFLKGVVMNAGKTLFAQLMDFLPWSHFIAT